MSNFVFSRRSLQRSIESLVGILEQKQLASIVDRLNHPSDARLPAMWELVMLDALSGVGVLRHEIQLPNGRRPDIELMVSPADREPFLIIGDVLTVSDAGLDKQNPVGTLFTELARLARKAGLNPNHFGYDIRGDRIGPYRNARVKLFLPTKGDLLKLIRKEVAPWINRLKAAPQRPDRFDHAKREIRFSLTYNPTQRYAGGGYLCYDVAASLSKNPLFRALKGKLDQMKQAPSTALRLLIACDGDCALLRQSPFSYSLGTFSAREVAEDFLRQNSSVDAVLLVGIDEQRQPLGSTISHRMKYDLVIAPKHARSARMTPVEVSALEALLRKAADRMPDPVRSAYNAAIRCQQPGCGPDMIGGYEMSNNSVSLSSRALQRLLAGEGSVDDFIAAHGWNEVSGPSNPFARMARSGRMISAIEVKPAGEKDDDWLTFRFGPRDPAAATFWVPDPAAAARSSDGKHGPDPIHRRRRNLRR